MMRRLRDARQSAGKSILVLLATLLACCCGPSRAGVMADGTRVIFSDGAAERTVSLVNTNDYPVMVQSWVDKGEGSNAPDTIVSSLFVMPSVFRLQPHEIKHVRILYTDDAPAPAEESVFWLNLYEIPILPPAPRQDSPRVLLGLNTQIKIFYRPAGLAAPGAAVADALHFRLEQEGGEWRLVCRNDSPYFASFGALEIREAGDAYPARQQADMMTPPRAERSYPIQAPAGRILHGPARLSYLLIDDGGNFLQRSVDLTLSPGT